MGRDVDPTWKPSEHRDEIDMVKELGAALDRTDEVATKERVREVLKRELEGAPSERAGRRARVRLLVIAAALAAASLGGIAVAQNDGAGTDAPAEEKIPYVQHRLEDFERELATLDTSSTEGAAKAEALTDRIDALRGVLDWLCADAGLPAGC